MTKCKCTPLFVVSFFLFDITYIGTSDFHDDPHMGSYTVSNVSLLALHRQPDLNNAAFLSIVSIWIFFNEFVQIYQKRVFSTEELKKNVDADLKNETKTERIPSAADTILQIKNTIGTSAAVRKTDNIKKGKKRLTRDDNPTTSSIWLILALIQTEALICKIFHLNGESCLRRLELLVNSWRTKRLPILLLNL